MIPHGLLTIGEVIYDECCQVLRHLFCRPALNERHDQLLHHGDVPRTAPVSSVN